MAVPTRSELTAIIRRIIEHHGQFQSSVGEVENEIIIDEEKGHFELIHTGWINRHRVHGAVIHIDIRGDKAWIQHDGTEDGVATELVAAGIPKDRIVLAFKSPEMRKYTEYAVG
jgi:hypothetical protein